MIVDVKRFDLTQDGYIVCPKCKQRKHFKLMADKIHHDEGIYEMLIGCTKCDWVSDEIYEDVGYFPDMSKEMIYTCLQDIHEKQMEGL